MGDFDLETRLKFKLLRREFAKMETNSCKNESFRPKFRAKFKLLWRGCVDRPKTPIIHGRKKYLQIRNTHCAWAKIFFHLWLYGEHTTTAENTKFRPIEKSNNHKGFQDSGNVFMRFSGLHLWLYGEQHFFMQLCFAERTVID